MTAKPFWSLGLRTISMLVCRIRAAQSTSWPAKPPSANTNCTGRRRDLPDGKVSLISETGQEPDVVIETDPDSIYQLLTGLSDLHATVATDRARITGDIDRAHRFFDAFQLDAPIEDPTIG
jgi:hypothetical protein